jgi:CubicO group peptidase (beta-lactamase class C family)
MAKLERAIDEVVSEHVDDDGPGLALLIVSDGEPLIRKGYGRASLDGEVISARSVFDLASVSKHITATAVSLLIEDGAITAEDEVREHVSGLTIATRGRPILVRDLLWHVSGLPDYSGDAWDGTDEAFERLTNEGLVEWLNGQRMVSAPGKRYEYNNSGYALLARLVECVSGKRYSEFARERMFGPLGMEHTFALDSTRRRIERRVTGYKEDGDDYVESLEPSVIQGDGNVFTCLDDLLRWERAMRDATLLSRESLEVMREPGTLDDGSEIDADGQGYGYGWSVDQDEDNPSISHSGAWAGTATYYVRYHDDEVTSVLLSNNEDLDVESLCEEIDEPLWESF